MHICYRDMPARAVPQNDIYGMTDETDHYQIKHYPGSAFFAFEYFHQADNSGKEVEGEGQFKK